MDWSLIPKGSKKDKLMQRHLKFDYSIVLRFHLFPYPVFSHLQFQHIRSHFQ